MGQIGNLIEGKELVFAEPNQNVRDVVKTMAERNVGAVPVLDDGKLVGLFSERDLMKRVVAVDVDPSATRVSEVMTRQLVVASPADSIADCVQRMHSVGCRHLPVIDDGKLVGMISLRDLLQVDSQSSRKRAEFLTELVTYSPDYES